MKKRQTYALLSLVLIVSVSSCYAQKRSTHRLNEDVDLPADFSIDFKLGSAERLAVQNDNASLHGTELGQVGEEVFRNLVGSTSVAALSLPYQWSLSFTNTSVINASSLPDGEIRVNAGLAQLIGTDRGLWAAVLSHEIAHVARRHWVKKYLYRLYTQQLIAYYQLRARQGDKSAPWVLLGLRIAVPIAERKLSRTLEHDADIQGMRLMAVAGYHPDSVFALHHRLRIQSGEQSKFAAFFQDHPRWETRDQRSEQAYSEALQQFNTLWPNSLSSPGGEPALVAFAGHPQAKENNTDGTVDLRLPLCCRNARDPVSLVIHLNKDKHELQTDNLAYRNTAGNFEYRQEINCADKDDAAPFEVRLPAGLVAERDRKAKVQVEVIGPKSEILESFSSFDAHFPKNHGRVGTAITASRAEIPVRLKTRNEIEEHGSEKGAIFQPASASSLGVSEKRDNALATEIQQLTDRSHRTEKLTNPFGIIGSSESSGFRIKEVTPDSAAAKAGFVVDDILMAADGTPLKDQQSLNGMAKRKPGSKITITFMHIAWVMNATLTVPDPADDVHYVIY
jgi:hypothetical protein